MLQFFIAWNELFGTLLRPPWSQKGPLSQASGVSKCWPSLPHTPGAGWREWNKLPEIMCIILTKPTNPQIHMRRPHCAHTTPVPCRKPTLTTQYETSVKFLSCSRTDHWSKLLWLLCVITVHSLAVLQVFYSYQPWHFALAFATILNRIALPTGRVLKHMH